MDSKKYLDELFELLRIPSISGDESYHGDCWSAADWLRARIERLGFNASLIETSFLPVVYAEPFDFAQGKPADFDESKPTILIYGHYDVQAPDPLDEWKSKPFEPEIRTGNLYARGAADDKGQLYTWIAALDRLLERGRTSSLPVNIKFLIEGAEEEGSRGLSQFIQENKKLLQADVCVLSDTHCLSPTQPVITYGLRGICYFEISVTALKADVHSGLYGGNVINPAQVLAEMISRMKAKDNSVKIDGFYEHVRVLDKQEKADLADFPFTNENILKETGAQVVVGEKNHSIPERAGARPTLDVNGMWSGFTGQGGKTIIPASAHAKISMRLVPHQKAADISEKFKAYIDKITPEGVSVEIKELHAAEPVLLDKNSSYFQAAAKAYETVFDAKPVYELSGGSIGVVADFKQHLGIDSVMMGYGLPDDGLHSPNEKLSVKMFEKGIETNMEFLKLISSN